MRRLYESGLSEACIRCARFNIKYTSNSWLKVLALVFKLVSWCLDIGKTLLLVFDITSRCFDIRWNTASGVWYITSRCLDIRLKHSFSCLIFHFSVFGYRMKHSLSCLIYYFSVRGNRKKKHFFSCLIQCLPNCLLRQWSRTVYRVYGFPGWPNQTLQLFNAKEPNVFDGSQFPRYNSLWFGSSEVPWGLFWWHQYRYNSRMFWLHG